MLTIFRNVEVSGRAVAKTHLASNTAFRGFGGPQGMLVIEEIMDRIARRLGLPAGGVVRARNLLPRFAARRTPPTTARKSATSGCNRALGTH